MTFSKKSAVLIAAVIKTTTSKTYDSIVSFYTSDVLKPYIKSEKRFFALDFLYKSEMLFIQNDPEKAISNIYDDIQKATAEFSKESGVCPKIIAIKNIGIYCIGSSKANTNAVYDAFLLSIKKIPPSKTLKAMTSSNSIFSDNILKGKVVIITGAAQGFGKGIATEMAKKGAYVVISDINESGIVKLATSLCETYGVGTAIAVRADVTRETDIIKLVETAVLTYGGVDVLINNAGIVKAGSLDDMTLSDFELVTKINYTAYFLCTKHVSKIMKLANKFNKENLYPKYNLSYKNNLSSKDNLNSANNLSS
ncbi:MAG: SDR family NAD(P)-dependent oxidoreductase, partial [Clostridia bacterium]